MSKKDNKYEHIIRLPHPTSKVHPRMSVSDRAAQFSPFSALTGYEAAIDETARLTEEKAEPDEYEKLKISETINEISENIGNHPEISVTYFIPDEKKAGGKYVSISGKVRKADIQNLFLMMQDGEKIPFSDIICLQIVK